MHALHTGGVQAVPPCCKLNDVPLRVPHGAVPLHLVCLLALGHGAILVPGLCGFHGGGHQALPPALHVVEKLVRLHAGGVGVDHEAAGGGAEGTRREHGQRAAGHKAGAHSVAVHYLLAQLRLHLRHIVGVALGARAYHGVQPIRGRAAGGRVWLPTHNQPGGVIQMGGQNCQNVRLHASGLGAGHLWRQVHGLLRQLRHQPVHLRRGGVQVGLHAGRDDAVRQAHGQALVRQPGIHQPLEVGEEADGRLLAVGYADAVDNPAGARAQCALAQTARHQLPVGDDDAPLCRVVGAHLRSRAADALLQEDAWQDHGNQLLAGPVRAAGGVQASGRREVLLSRNGVVDHAHALVHEVPADAHRALGEQHAPRARVLHQAQAGLVVLGVHHVARHGHELHRLRIGQHGLQHVQVHLVAVKVRVVRAHYRQRHGDGQPVNQPDAVHHQGQLVQGGLAVKHHPVTVQQVALHQVANLQVQLGALPLLHVLQL